MRGEGIAWTYAQSPYKARLPVTNGSVGGIDYRRRADVAMYNSSGDVVFRITVFGYTIEELRQQPQIMFGFVDRYRHLGAVGAVV